MANGLTEILRCPQCRQPLIQQGAEELRCAQQHRYPVRRGIPRFVTDDGYTSNFSFEWQVHKRTQFDTDKRFESEETFLRKTGFTPAQLRGKRVLDIGVGAGRFADVAARWEAEVVGIDLSYAVESARDNLQRYPNAQVIQADIFNLPFADESFDYIFSIGVLHHTPDCRAAFMALPRLLRRGGEIAIWLYDAYRDDLSTSELWRKLARPLPRSLLYGLCHLAVPGYYLYKIPVLRAALHHYLPPLSRHPDWRWRVLDTFDWYSPRYQSHHTYPEVYGWFREAGLVNIEPLPDPVGMKGHRP